MGDPETTESDRSKGNPGSEATLEPSWSDVGKRYRGEFKKALHEIAPQVAHLCVTVLMWFSVFAADSLILWFLEWKLGQSRIFTVAWTRLGIFVALFTIFHCGLHLLGIGVKQTSDFAEQVRITREKVRNGLQKDEVDGQ